MSELEENGFPMASEEDDQMVSRTVSGTSFITNREDSAEAVESGYEDFEEIQPNYLVDQALEQCKKFLYLYYIIIKIFGWTQLSKENRLCLRIFRWCLVIFWTLLLIFAFIIQDMTCYLRDRFNIGDNVNTTNGTERQISCRNNVVFILAVLDITILITYWLGLILFSGEEKEYTLNLAEKTFIKLTTNPDASTKPVIRTIWGFIIVGLLWILYSIVTRVMNAVTVRLYESDTIIRSGALTFRDEKKIVLITISFLLFTLYDMVYLMAVTNYVVQSEMIIYLTHSVRELVKQKQYPSMDAAVKDICDIRGKIHKLNGKTATVAAMALFNVVPNVTSALTTLDDLRTMNRAYKNEYLAFITAVLNVILWIVPLLFPYIQAARVTHQCEKLKEVGFYVRSRPFQYGKTKQSELDSFLIFTLAAKLRATMCGVPIYPWLLYALLVVASVIFVIIFPLEVYDIKQYLNG